MARGKNTLPKKSTDKPGEMLSLKPGWGGISLDLKELWRQTPAPLRGVVFGSIVFSFFAGAAAYYLIDRSDILWMSAATISKDRDKLTGHIERLARDVDTLRNADLARNAAGAPTRLMIDGLTARGNGRDGVRIEGRPVGSMKNIDTSGNGDSGFVIK